MAYFILSYIAIYLALLYYYIISYIDSSGCTSSTDSDSVLSYRSIISADSDVSYRSIIFADNDGIQIGYGDPEENHLTILNQETRTYKQLGASGMRLTMCFNQPPPVGYNYETWLHDGVTKLLELIRVTLNIQPQDYVGMIFNNENSIRTDFSISLRRFDQYDAELIFSQLSSVLQSNEEFIISDKLVIRVDHAEMPLGFGRSVRLVGTTFTQYVEDRPKAIFDPILKAEHNTLCLAVGIVLGRAYAAGVTNKNRYNYLTYSPNYQELIDEALMLCGQAGVDLSNGGGIDEIRGFDEYLQPEYEIIVYNCSRGRSTFFKSHNENAEKKQIRLLLENNHYVLILSPTAAFGFGYYCEPCNAGFSDPLRHRACPYKCPCCYAKPPCVKRSQNVMCDVCNRGFRSLTCFNNHIKSKLCSKIKICGTCYRGYKVNKRTPHSCESKYCRICCRDQPLRHDCFMPVTIPKTIHPPKELFIFYDFECMQDKPFADDPTKYEHKPNLCAVQIACGVCSNELSHDITCENCGVRSHIFKSDDVVAELMSFIANTNKKFKTVTIIAHNMQGYDGHFCLRHMYRHRNVWRFDERTMIMNGTKILKINVGRFTFLDSLNFFMAPLAKLPEMFKLQAAKGYYPHYFNTLDNSAYIGPLPDQKYYSPDTMRPKERKMFMQWYNQEASRTPVFNNQVELEKYCVMDVTILRQACLKFRTLLLSITEVDPFKNVTIASTCMSVFKSHFLKENTIGVMPPRGYRLTDRQSKKAFGWLEWVQLTQGVRLKTALNGQEVRIAHDILVDGFDENTNTVYEFYGCYWHQCRNCFPIQAHKDVSDTNLNYSLRYDSTIARSYQIKRLGFNLVEMWECEFDKILKNAPHIKHFIESLSALNAEPLNPRDAFFGGRTNACKLYHKTSNGEKVHYYDVCSLYPYINKYFSYPVGHPEVLIGGDLENVTVFNTDGLFKCIILPPRNLYHPVLPLKLHKKLMFVLCYTCALNKFEGICGHSETERCFTGTYVADELRVACKEGYVVVKILECWKYKMTQYDRVSKTGGIFTGYINTFLKIKTEASGYPDWCLTDDDKNRFIADFYAREGITLDKQAIACNPGLRSLAKLMLNSLWGKLGQRDDKMQKAVVNTQQQLLNIITNPAYEAESFTELTQDSLLVAYKLRAESLHTQPNVSVVMAAYTTANARLELYRYLKFLGRRALYFDTDSVIFTQKPGEENLPLGDYLGDLTDEIASYGAGSYISEFVTGGPKNYAFKVEIPGKQCVTVCKVKGINLHHQNSQSVNFDKIKMCVFNELDHVDLVNRLILRTNDNFVYSTSRKYAYKVNVTKRRRIGEYGIHTLPYGYMTTPTDVDP